MTKGPRRARWQAAASYALGLGVLAGVLLYLDRQESLGALVARYSGRSVAAGAAGVVVGLLALSLLQVLMARSLDVRLGYWESAALGVVSRGGNIFTPVRAGTVYRAAYLEGVHQLPIAHYASLAVGNQAILFLVGCSVAVVALGARWLAGSEASGTLLLLACAGVALVLCGLAFARKVSWSGSWLRLRLAQLVNGLHTLARDRAMLCAAVSLRLLALAANAVVYRVMLTELGAAAGWWACALIAVAAALSTLSQLVPGGLGVAELVVALLAGSFDVPAPLAVAAVLLYRLCGISLLIMLMLPSWLWLRRIERRQLSDES